MCLHSFNQTFINDITYCSNCGCISFWNTPFNKPSSFNSKHTIDPLLSFHLSKQKEMEAVRKTKIQFDPFYFQVRKIGINNVRSKVQSMKYDRSLLYKAVLYMDLIYSKGQMPLDLIEEVSGICFFLAAQFTECGSHSSTSSLFNYLNDIPYYHQFEILCLKSLDYDLGQLSAYDYLLNLFSMGITSSRNVEGIKGLYRSCFIFLETIINDIRYLDFSPCDIALSIIKTQCDGKASFSLSQFSYIYNINYCEGNLMKCTFVLSIISRFNNKPRPYSIKRKEEKTSSNASCSTLDSIDVKETITQVEFEELSKTKGSNSY